MKAKRASIGHRRRSVFFTAFLAVAIVIGLASVASAHVVTGIEADCSAVNIHFADFPSHPVNVHIVVVVNYRTAFKDVSVDKNTTDATVDISWATAPMFGNTSAVWIDVTWTNYGDQHVHKVMAVTCGVRPTTTTRSTSTTKSTTTTRSSTTTSSTSTTSTTVQGTTVGTQIFQVEFRDCHVLHVGYDDIPAGTTVHWMVRQGGKSFAVGDFVAVAGKGMHFLSQDLGKNFAQTPRKGNVTFTWTANGTSYTYGVARTTGC